MSTLAAVVLAALPLWAQVETGEAYQISPPPAPKAPKLSPRLPAPDVTLPADRPVIRSFGVWPNRAKAGMTVTLSWWVEPGRVEGRPISSIAIASPSLGLDLRTTDPSGRHRFVIPERTPAGTYPFTIAATDDKGRQSLQSATVEVALLPDLIVRSIGIDPSGIITLTVKNIGPGPMPSDWRTMGSFGALVYVDGGRGIFVDLSRPESGDLSRPGGEAVYRFGVHIRESIVVAVDASSTILENDEHNNGGEARR